MSPLAFEEWVWPTGHLWTARLVANGIIRCDWKSGEDPATRNDYNGGGDKEVGCGQCVLYHALNCHTEPLDMYINVDKKIKQNKKITSEHSLAAPQVSWL